MNSDRKQTTLVQGRDPKQALRMMYSKKKRCQEAGPSKTWLPTAKVPPGP